MRYIRYLIYGVLELCLLVGGFSFYKLMCLMLEYEGRISLKGVVSAVVVASIPMVVGMRKELGKKWKQTIGASSNYLAQECRYIFPDAVDWKEDFKTILNNLFYDYSVYNLWTEGQDYLIYRSEASQVAMRGGLLPRRTNSIIVELRRSENMGIQLLVHKENRHTELSNRDCEQVLGLVVERYQESQDSLDL